MRKIDKTRILSTVYKKWEEELEASQTPHPEYTSSKHKHYQDIVMNLFHCQGGLCAYTEKFLCTPDFYEDKHWKSGKYCSPKPETNGQLDHFDESLKFKTSNPTGTKSWLWDNFFMIDSDTNIKKRDKPVDDILKPDRAGYDPFELLEYNDKMHVYIANTDLSEATQERINNMIDILGINHSSIKTRRKHTITQYKKSKEFDMSFAILEFPTAIEMAT